FTQSQRRISLRQAPPAKRRGVRQSTGVLAVRGGLLPTAGLAAQFRGLLSTAVAVVARRWRPSRKNGESLLARRASARPAPRLATALLQGLQGTLASAGL